MAQIATINFVDLDSGDKAMAAVRVVGNSAGLALSLMRNGDVEVFLGANELDRLIEALQSAREKIGGGGST